jgi:hypothetical protein
MQQQDQPSPFDLIYVVALDGTVIPTIDGQLPDDQDDEDDDDS